MIAIRAPAADGRGWPPTIRSSSGGSWSRISESRLDQPCGEAGCLAVLAGQGGAGGLAREALVAGQEGGRQPPLAGCWVNRAGMSVEQVAADDPLALERPVGRERWPTTSESST